MKFFLSFKVFIFLGDRVTKISVFVDFYPWLDLCANATWKENASTFADQSIVGSDVRGLFIDRHDHIYVADHTHQRILVWPPDQSNPQRSLSVPLSRYSDVFVGMNGDIFFEHGSEVGRIEKWSPDRNESVFVAKFEGHCYSLFIDTNNSLYCSLRDQHKVMKISLNSDEKGKAVSVAGNRVWGIRARSIGSAVGNLRWSRVQLVCDW